MADPDLQPRLAEPGDAPELGGLLHDFNVEFDTPSPGPAAIRRRLERLLAGDRTFAVLAGRPAAGVGLVTLRPNVWYDGPVALLDELYVVPERRNQGVGSELLTFVMSTCRARGVELVEINVDEADVAAQRFYARHGFALLQPETGERAFYLSQEL